MVFGWTQIVMDLQPLVVMFTGSGHLHGFTHTYIGAGLIAVFCALTGKYLAEYGLKLLNIVDSPMNMAWRVCFISAFIGSVSHVFLDSMMHLDVEPFYPLSLYNPLLAIISVPALHQVCLYSGLLGAAV